MTDRFNTIAGWTLFAGVVALGLSAISSRIFHADNPERPEQLGYVIEGVEEEGGADEGPDLATLLQTGSAEMGEAVFAKCTACHSIEQGGSDGIGPNLYGVLGQPIAAASGSFAYSDALAGHGGEWTYDDMSAWLESPRGFASGTKMSFAGLGSAEDRANVMLYMREYGGGPPLPEPAAPEEVAPEEGLDGRRPRSGRRCSFRRHGSGGRDGWRAAHARRGIAIRSRIGQMN
jgi:cytochrome c